MQKLLTIFQVVNTAEFLLDDLLRDFRRNESCDSSETAELCDLDLWFPLINGRSSWPRFSFSFNISGNLTLTCSKKCMNA